MPDPFDEVDRNFEAFQSRLPEIIFEYHGQYALMHDCQIVGYYASALIATAEGIERFGQGRFSVQEVTTARDSLGFYSYVGVSGHG